MWDCVISGGKDEKLPRPLGPRPEPGLRGDRHLSRLRPVLSTGLQCFQGYTENHRPSAAVPGGESDRCVSASRGRSSPSAGCGDWKSRYGSASRRSPPPPTSAPPPTARLQKVPLPGSGDGESDSEADLFPPERHRVSTATPGQPTVTELGRQVGEAIQKLEGRRDSALNSGPIPPAQSVQQLIKQIPAVGSCASVTPSAALPHCTTAEGAPATERRWAGIIRGAVLEGSCASLCGAAPVPSDAWRQASVCLCGSPLPGHSHWGAGCQSSRFPLRPAVSVVVVP
ncbi:uncharacterized protein LOC124417212 [Gallus gallus]|uniref:uncharacterized protein LOC124417212 n=1 Tax=Gallus gallus TaxID=9031 RepID=UPI001F023ECE|nr:uncharacterized protein LOC124417212 [Gallus gallus]